MRLAFDVYTSFSQVIWRQAQHESGFYLLPYENLTFTDNASGIRLSNFSELAINRKNDNDLTIC